MSGRHVSIVVKTSTVARHGNGGNANTVVDRLYQDGVMGREARTEK